MLSEQARCTLLSMFNPDQVITDPAELLVYEVDAAQDRGTPDAVVLPESAEEVCRLVAWANQHQVALISRGGRDGPLGWRGGRARRGDRRILPPEPHRRAGPGRAQCMG